MKTNDIITIEKRIKAYLKVNGIAMAEVANSINMAVSTFIEQIRKGNLKVSDYDLIVKYLKVSPDYFFINRDGITYEIRDSVLEVKDTEEAIYKTKGLEKLIDHNIELCRKNEELTKANAELSVRLAAYEKREPLKNSA